MAEICVKGEWVRMRNREPLTGRLIAEGTSEGKKGMLWTIQCFLKYMKRS
jgi:hypothetical protein